MRREIDQHAREFDECRVRFWQGYVTGQFYVRDPRDGAVVASPAFRTWRPPWHPRVRVDDSPEAVRAFEALRHELTRLGWSPSRRSGSLTERVFVRNGASPEPEPEPVPLDPTDIAEQLLLRALAEVAGESGATAAQLGRALYGDAAGSVDHLPQRLGARLRRLQLQGKVARRHAHGVSQWSLPARGGARNGAAPRER